MFQVESTADRIRKRREELGWSQAELAFAAGTSLVTVNHLERGLSKNSMYLGSILAALGMGASSNVYLDAHLILEDGQCVVDSARAPVRVLPPPDLANSMAILVRGDCLAPLCQDGDILVVDRVVCDHAQLLGRLCYVKLRNGRRYVMTLAEGSKPGHYTLFGQRPPVFHDVELDEVWPVVWIKMSGISLPGSSD